MSRYRFAICRHTLSSPEIAVRQHRRLAGLALSRSFRYLDLTVPDHLPADTPATAPELLTVEEVANLLRTTPSAVRERAKRGAIPGAVVGMKPRRFRAADVRAWLGLSVSG